MLLRRGMQSLKRRTDPVSDSSRNNSRSPRMHQFVQNKLHPMVVSIALCTASLATPTLAQNKQATPGYNNKIPEKIMTPDKVQTSDRKSVV